VIGANLDRIVHRYAIFIQRDDDCFFEIVVYPYGYLRQRLSVDQSIEN